MHFTRKVKTFGGREVKTSQSTLKSFEWCKTNKPTSRVGRWLCLVNKSKTN